MSHMTARTPKKDPNLDTLGRRKSPGRGTLLNATTQERLFTLRRMGISWSRCCRLAGIGYTTMKGWRQTGRDSVSIPDKKRTAFQQKCVTFSALADLVDDEWVQRCETVLHLAMTPAQDSATWRQAASDDKDRAVSVAKWKLAHQASDEYNTKERSEVSGPDGAPINIDVEAGEVFARLLRAREFDDGKGDDDAAD